MAEVIQLDEYRPHTSGPGQCLHCGYQAIVVIPAGQVSIECPECRLFKLVRQGFVLYDEQNPDTARCSECDGMVFVITKVKGVLCCTCGEVFEQPINWPGG